MPVSNPPFGRGLRHGRPGAQGSRALRPAHHRRAGAYQQRHARDRARRRSRRAAKRTSVDDLRPAVREFHALVKEGIPKDKLTFAFNRIGTANEESEARAYVAEAGYTALDGCLLERPAYRKAQNGGLAVTETSYAGLNAKADALIQALIDKVT